MWSKEKREKIQELIDRLHEIDTKYDHLTRDLMRRRNLLLTALIRECEKDEM